MYKLAVNGPKGFSAYNTYVMYERTYVTGRKIEFYFCTFSWKIVGYFFCLSCMLVVVISVIVRVSKSASRKATS